VRFLSDEERVHLLNACKASSSPYLYTIVLTALSTDARKGDLLNLRWPDIDLSQGRIIIHDTKNSERRNVPLAGPALDLMRQYARVRRIDTDLVFPSSRGDTPVEIKRAWYTALRQAEIEDFKFHDLCHSAASYLAMNGASLTEIAEILGHKTLAIALFRQIQNNTRLSAPLKDRVQQEVDTLLEFLDLEYPPPKEVNAWKKKLGIDKKLTIDDQKQYLWSTIFEELVDLLQKFCSGPKYMYLKDHSDAMPDQAFATSRGRQVYTPVPSWPRLANSTLS
jgi:hypothetical protein